MSVPSSTSNVASGITPSTPTGTSIVFINSFVSALNALYIIVFAYKSVLSYNALTLYPTIVLEFKSSLTFSASLFLITVTFNALFTSDGKSGIVPFVVIAMLSEWICSWYGKSYEGMQSVLNVCMLTTVINSITNVFTQNLIAMNQNWYLFWTRLMRDLITIGVATLLIIYFERGALMYAIACLCFQFLYMILLTYKQKAIYRNM